MLKKMNLKLNLMFLYFPAKRIKHEGHIAQQGYNNGTVKLHLGDESSANENGKKLIVYFAFDLL